MSGETITRVINYCLRPLVYFGAESNVTKWHQYGAAAPTWSCVPSKTGGSYYGSSIAVSTNWTDTAHSVSFLTPREVGARRVRRTNSLVVMQNVKR